MAQVFAGVEKFLRCQLEQDYAYVGKGKEVPRQGSAIGAAMQALIKEHPHCGHVKLNRLRTAVEFLGIEKVTEIAANNLSPYTFSEACQKALYRRR